MTLATISTIVRFGFAGLFLRNIPTLRQSPERAACRSKHFWRSLHQILHYGAWRQSEQEVPNHAPYSPCRLHLSGGLRQTGGKDYNRGDYRRNEEYAPHRGRRPWLERLLRGELLNECHGPQSGAHNQRTSRPVPSMANILPALEYRSSAKISRRVFLARIDLRRFDLGCASSIVNTYAPANCPHVIWGYFK